MSVAAAMPVVTRRGERDAPKQKGHWTAELDAQLAAAVALHGFEPPPRQAAAHWCRIAASMGLPAAQFPTGGRRCQRRWRLIQPGNEGKLEEERARNRARMKQLRHNAEFVASLVGDDWDPKAPLERFDFAALAEPPALPASSAL